MIVVYKRYMTLSPLTASIEPQKMPFKPLHVKKSDKDIVTGVYVQAPSSKKKTGNPVSVIVKINGSGVPIGANPVPVSRDDRMSDPFRGLENTGLTTGGMVMKVNEGAGFMVDLRSQLALAAEKRLKNMVVVDQIVPPLVQVAVLPDAAPPPVEVAVLPDAELPLVDVAVVPEVAPPPIDVDAQLNGTSRYPKRNRTQKNVGDENDKTITRISPAARHAFKSTVKGFGGK